MHYQTSLFNTQSYEKIELNYKPIYDPAWDYTDATLQPTKTVLEQVTPDTNKFAPEQHTHWIEEYSPSNRRKHKYYRYCWMVGRKIKHLHIRGGNTKTPLVIYRKLDIEDLILTGETPDKIVEIIKKQFK